MILAILGLNLVLFLSPKTSYKGEIHTTFDNNFVSKSTFVPDVGEKVGVSGIVDGADDAVAAVVAAAVTAAAAGTGRVAVGRRLVSPRRRFAVGIGEA